MFASISALRSEKATLGVDVCACGGRFSCTEADTNRTPDRHLLGCQVQVGSDVDVFVITVGTFELASNNWSRATHLVPGSVWQESAYTWQMFVADDSHLKAGWRGPVFVVLCVVRGVPLSWNRKSWRRRSPLCGVQTLASLLQVGYFSETS